MREKRGKERRRRGRDRGRDRQRQRDIDRETETADIKRLVVRLWEIICKKRKEKRKGH